MDEGYTAANSSVAPEFHPGLQKHSFLAISPETIMASSSKFYFSSGKYLA